MSKIGITGASGQLGNLVVAKLKERTSAENLLALVRDTDKVAHEGIEARAFDYNKPEGMASSLKGIDTLLLISGNEIGQRARQHANVIDAAKAAGINWIVYTSLLHADTSGISLAGEHLETENKLKASGIRYTILRNGWYTENYTGSVQSAVGAGTYIGSAGEGKISSAARADFAEAAAVVLTSTGHEGKIYELAGDSAYTLNELANEISKAAGKEIMYQNLSASDYANALKGMGLPEDLAEAIAGWDVSASRGDLFDNGNTLSKLIGRPTTPLREVVKSALSNHNHEIK